MLVHMSSQGPYARFAGLRFDDFQRMARDESLSPNERSGFPESYRAGAEWAILADILAKLPALGGEQATVVDVGCGSTPLTLAIGKLCHDHDISSSSSRPDVLAQLPEAPGVTKLAGRFPDLPLVEAQWTARCHAIIAYSVMQFVFVEASIFGFLDAALAMLRPGGRILLGDLPNHSLRRRFLASEAGRAFHHQYMQTDDEPDVSWPVLPTSELDDASVISLLSKRRRPSSTRG